MHLFAVAMALLLGGVQPSQEEALFPEVPAIVEFVDVRGNRRVRRDAILYNIQTREGGILNRAVIARDIRALYALEYFERITVEEEPGEEGVIITFVFEEKPLIRQLDYVGNSTVTDSDILERFRERNVGLSIEQPYDPARIRRAQNVILDLLAEHGRQNATVEIDNYEIPPNSVGVDFVIDEGPQIKVEDIEVVGNEIFSEGEIKNQMELIKEVGPITSIMDKDLLPSVEDERRPDAHRIVLS